MTRTIRQLDTGNERRKTTPKTVGKKQKYSANLLHPEQMVSCVENNIPMSDFLNFVRRIKGSIRPDR